MHVDLTTIAVRVVERGGVILLYLDEYDSALWIAASAAHGSTY